MSDILTKKGAEDAQSSGTATDSSESKLKLFFYIKGSKDFPTGHLISQKFGFSKTVDDAVTDLSNSSETAIFSNTIKDIMLKVKDVREVNNLYSLYSDNDNNIPIRGDTYTRLDRSQEFISTMLISNASDKIYSRIYPNYTYTSIDEITNESNGATDDKISLRERVFWQKVFTLIEFLKKEEYNIILDQLKSLNPKEYEEHKNDPLWFGDSDSEKFKKVDAALKKEISSAGKYIGLFVGGKDTAFTTIAEDAINPKDSYNPFRMLQINGHTDHDSLSDKEKEEEQLWGKYGIKIEYEPGTAIFQQSIKENRISYISFKLKYCPVANKNTAKIWNIEVYFDPDEFVKKSENKSLEVWTYNDADLDQKYGDISNLEGFNPLDNDYGNILSDDSTIKNNFVVTQDEMEHRIISEVVKKCSENYSKDYTIFTTKRVTPFLKEVNPEDGSDPVHEICWETKDNSNVRDQKFFIFYPSSDQKPTEIESIKVVKEYLLDLHNSCHDVVYADPEHKDVKYIGHGKDFANKNAFLSKMYPNIFNDIELHIIPADASLCFDPETTTWDPSTYYHAVTPSGIYTTVKRIHYFEKFTFSKDGKPEITSDSGTQSKFPIEVFYLGGIKPSQDSSGDGEIRYDFPWICALYGDQIVNPLTSQKGFADYKQKLFTMVPGDTSTPADILQYILLNLTERMFIKETNKAMYTSILGINIHYEQSYGDDPTVVSNSAYNVAKFIVNNVKFVVHSQLKKYFGYVTSEHKTI